MTDKFAEAFYKLMGGSYTAYDSATKTYIDEGYNGNPIVYSVVQQMATKTMAVPYEVKRKKKDNALKTYRKHKKNNIEIKSPSDLLNRMRLKNEAMDDEILAMPMEKPNPLQSWEEFIAITKTFLRLTGNYYWYKVAPEDGPNKGTPIAVYVLPSQFMNIVLKEDALMLINESPIDHYTLVEGQGYTKFEAENVYHGKFPNPNFDYNGRHLYGQSPLMASLGNVQSSNEAIGNNIKMMKNSGAFGIIHGVKQPLEHAQALQLKERLKEMDADTSRFSNIAGLSTEVAFTRINLTTDELKPFDYLKYDEKQICNVLGWSDKLLNNDQGAKYDNVSQFRKQVITDNIVPDLDLITPGFEAWLFPAFKNYENTIIDFDVTQLPEMQQDVEKMVGWLKDLLDRGIIHRNEFRTALQYPVFEGEEMEIMTVGMGIMPLTQALMAPEDFNNDPDIDEEEDDDDPKKKDGFNPNQARNPDGTWGNGASRDDIAQGEFGLDYNQLGPGEREWVDDEYGSPGTTVDLDEMSETEKIARKLKPGQKFNVGEDTTVYTFRRIQKNPTVGFDEMVAESEWFGESSWRLDNMEYHGLFITMAKKYKPGK